MTGGQVDRYGCTMLISSIAIALCTFQGPPAPILVVDWFGAGDHTTITGALNDSSIIPGAKIFVRGLTDQNGLPIAYAERGPNLPVDPTLLLPMETFPLQVAEGVQILPYPGSPAVYIWSDGSVGSPSALIEISNTGDLSPLTRIKGVRLVGGGQLD